MLLPYIYIFSLSLLTTLVVTPLVIKLAFRIGAVDKPGYRKIHRTVMPRLGGLGIYLGFMVSLLVFLELNAQVAGIILGGTVILVTGIVDDIRGISPWAKLSGQALAALLVIYLGGITVTLISNPFDGYIQLGLLSVPFTLLWIMSVTNAVNLVDGLDGLASGISIIALTTFSVISYFMGHTTVSLLAAGLGGAILGFLRYNFFPARLFLGDSGSLFLGFNVAVLAVLGLLKGVTLLAFIIPILVLGVPIADTFYAVCRRFLARRPIFAPDKSHIHHRLLKKGYSHPQVVVMIYLASLFFSASALLVVRNFNFLR